MLPFTRTPPDAKIDPYLIPFVLVFAGMIITGSSLPAIAQNQGSVGRQGDWEINITPQDIPKKRELVPHAIIGDSIPKSLTGKAGDRIRGKALIADPDEGNCLACHSIPIPEEPFHGTIGPDLRGIASRMSIGQIRLRLVNPKIVNSKSMMPSYYINSGRHRVRADVRGRPILEAQDIEDILAFLKTMTH